MALTVPSNARRSFGNMSSSGSEMFVSGLITLDGSGNGSAAHGMTELSGSGGRVAAGAVPSHAWFIPVSGDDFSGAALAVTNALVSVTGGPVGGKLILFALRL